MAGPFEQWPDNTDLNNEQLQFEFLCFHRDRLCYLLTGAKPNQSKTKMHSCPKKPCEEEKEKEQFNSVIQTSPLSDLC